MCPKKVANVKRVPMLFLLFLALTTSVFAQQSSQDQKTNQEQEQKNANKGVQEKKDAQDTAESSRLAVEGVFRQIRDGLEGHSQRAMLRAFDGERMEGFLSFQDQLESFFSEYSDLRVNIRIVQSTIENDKAAVTANFTLEETSRAGQTTRKEGRLSFELEHTKKGWKIVDFSPRNFFS